MKVVYAQGTSWRCCRGGLRWSKRLTGVAVLYRRWLPHSAARWRPLEVFRHARPAGSAGYVRPRLRGLDGVAVSALYFSMILLGIRPREGTGTWFCVAHSRRAARS